LRFARNIPSFSLYGERPAAVGRTDCLHIEDIQSRSRKYQWKIGTHRHTRLCQCVVVTSGPVIVTLDESRQEFADSALVIIPAGTVHSFRFRAETRGYVLTVDLDRLLTMAAAAHHAPIEALFREPYAIEFGADPRVSTRIAPLLERLMEEFRQPESLDAPINSWLACSALWLIAVVAGSRTPAALPSGNDLDRIRRFRVLIESRFLTNWPVAQYARQLGLSETSLNRLCRRLSGGTAFDLIQQRMALEARRRLVYVTGSVAAIAAELGFADPAYFCRFFRRHSGLSPGAFRRRQSGG
jgi:AraC family transcriptional activator of pobA